MLGSVLGCGIGEGRCGERCGEVLGRCGKGCWDVGEVKGDVGRSVLECGGGKERWGVWGSVGGGVGKCVGVWGR